MKEYYVDLHVHVGRSSKGKEVKKATAANLTFENIAFESYHRKGINVIGVVDCASPYIIEDIEALLDKGEIKEKEGGGMDYGEGQTLILGAEIETHEIAGCSAHSLCFFPFLMPATLLFTESHRFLAVLYRRSILLWLGYVIG
ncbi:MAG: hypothetical protein ACYCYE_00035 [Clostridia bacterium]